MHSVVFWRLRRGGRGQDGLSRHPSPTSTKVDRVDEIPCQVRRISYMYEALFRHRNLGNDLARPEAVSHHLGSLREFLAYCRRVIDAAAQRGTIGVLQIAPYLFGWIADPRTLRASWDYLAREGGAAPGPNGHRFTDLVSHEVWSLCRALGQAIRDGSYRPGPERECRILKGPGRGFRSLSIRNIEDRVVERAVVLVAQPLLDPLFMPFSFGFRPRRDRLHALAQAEHTATHEGRWIWLAEDLKNAFDHVPHGRLLDLVRKYLVAADLGELISTIICNDAARGLRQGGPLSPLLLLLYLHHHLDRPWSKRNAGRPPLVRVADDLLVLCRTRAEAMDARAQLEELLTPAGMLLKGTTSTTVHDLDEGGAAEWLGFALRAGPQCLAVSLAERSWARLDEHLALVHQHADAPLRANAIIKGWLAQAGPCYPWAGREQDCARIAAIARHHAFDEIPSVGDLSALWQRAYARWCRLRWASYGRAISKALPEKRFSG